MRILGICGSLQSMSANLTLLHAAQAAVPADVEFVLFEGLSDLPHFNPDLEKDGPVPAVQRWREAIASSDALFVASPEYGFSLPGVLKNAIDWVIGTAELERKIIAVTASTPGPGRGVRGLDALKMPLGAVSADIVGGEPIVRGPGAAETLCTLVAALVARVRTLPSAPVREG